MMDLMRSRPGRWALLILVLAYAGHFLYCADSILPAFDRAFANPDMHANLRWAQTIREQGWINPNPYHPYNTWTIRPTMISG